MELAQRVAKAIQAYEVEVLWWKHPPQWNTEAFWAGESRRRLGFFLERMKLEPGLRWLVESEIGLLYGWIAKMQRARLGVYVH